jgi:F-type H+-transporting ATPase subunit delta
MAERLSRRKIAKYVADNVSKGVAADEVISEVAAYLIDSRRTRELALVVRAIEDELADRGEVIANVTTARTLDDSLKKSVESLVRAKTIHLRESIDESVIGGVKIDLPGATLDATIKRKLLALRQAKQ